MARHIAYASPRGVSIYRDDVRVTYRHADLAGDSRGVNLDEADDILEQLGYVGGTWRWNAERGEWKTVAHLESSIPKRDPWWPRFAAANPERAKEIRRIAGK